MRFLTIILFLLVVSCSSSKISYYGSFQKEEECPLTIIHNEESDNYFIDFGKDAFCQIQFNFSSDTDNDSIEIWLGEQAVNDTIIKKPIGNKIAEKFVLHLKKDIKEYFLQFDKRKNYASASIIMPDSIGEVIPFRYCEIRNYKHKINKKDVKRFVVSNIFDDRASYFKSSDTILNQVYDLCKHTMKSTSFCGYFVDGNRERIPYEGDILINQLSWFTVSNDYSIAKRTLNHIIENPTWPTEYILQTLIIAYQYYLYSGDSSVLMNNYEKLKYKTLYMLRDKDGLIPTGNGIRDTIILKQVGFKLDCIRDMVDWPKCGDFDWGENSNIIDTTDFGEDDYYVYENYNTVINCFHYKAILFFSKIAEIVGNESDSKIFREYAIQTKNSINKYLTDGSLYKDGMNTNHKSLHSNMVALYCSVVESYNKRYVVDYIKQKGMCCSVYGAQFLLESLFDSGEYEYAYNLLTNTSKRSWYNMIREGSTLTTEAWDDCYKPNQDWNHAWGAVPCNIIVRKLAGIEPLEPGFKKVRIKPSKFLPNNLELQVPTERGKIYFSYKIEDGEQLYKIIIPKQTESEIILSDGRVVHSNEENNIFSCHL